MYTLFLRIAFRNLRKNRVFSAINIGGLALGITAYIFILEYVGFEKSVNQFHADLPQTYRLINLNTKGETWAQVEPGWGPKMKELFPEVESFCRFEEGVSQGIVSRTDQKSEPFREMQIGYVEGNFFDFFTFPIEEGSAGSLQKPNTVFLSRESADRYFGKENPIGKSLTLFNQFGKTNYTVEGVFRMPPNSDIQYSMVFSLETLRNPANLNGNGWAQLDNLSSQYAYTFFKLKKGTSIPVLEDRFNQIRKKLSTNPDGVQFRLQPFANIHLASSLSDTYQTTGNLKYIYILSLIAILILAIAWFNYVNLSTATIFKRANEVGVRKVIGASQGSLLVQFFMEALVSNVLGFSLALMLVASLQPSFNELIGKPLSLQLLLTSPVCWIGLALLFVGSLLSGTLAAIRLSGFNPVETLKGKINKSQSGQSVRKALVITQFAISIALIVSAILINKQLNFMQDTNLGVELNQMLVLKGPEMGKDSTFSTRLQTFRNEISSLPFVEKFATTGSVPGEWYNFMTAGFTQPSSKPGDEFKTYSFAIVDELYVDAYGIKLLAGRNFTAAECETDWNQNDKVILNEKAVREFGFRSPEEALQTRIQWDERQLSVIGVVKDYHHTSLQRAIDPLIFYPQKNSSFISIRMSSASLLPHLKQIETVFKQHFPGNPFDHFFADEHFNSRYFTEKQYSTLFTLASVLAIAIACLGLFGLTTFTIESRTKEIGVRKVLGASVAGITRLLTVDFLKLVATAAVLSFPVSWYLMDQWLEDFAYRTNIDWTVFALAGVIAVVIAFVTISVQALRAATANPVKSLRTE